MPRRHDRWLIVAAAVLTLAAPAYANAGTAMLWLIPGHLLIGNAIIGVCEWAVLVALLGKPRNPNGKSAAVMVAANYLSAWGGVLLLPTVWREFITRQYPEPLYQMGPVIVTSWLALFVFSILVEWLFIGWAMNQMSSKRRVWLRSLRASVIVNVASYAALTGLYFLVCPVTLATQSHLDPSLAFARGVPARVIYLGDDGNIWSVRPDGGERKRLEGARGTSSKWPQLYLALNSETALLDLYEQGDRRPLARSLGRAPVFPEASAPGAEPSGRPQYKDAWMAWKAMDLRATGADGHVAVGTFAAEGIAWSEVSSNRQNTLRLALETPFMSLTPSSATLVGDDLLIYGYIDAFHTDYRRIVVLDLRSRRLGILANGRSPVVVLDELPAGAEWAQPSPADPVEPPILKHKVEKRK